MAQSPIRFVRGPARVASRPEPEAVATQAAPAGPLPAASDLRWRELIELDARLGKERGIRLLTPEARVLLFLTLSGPVSVTEAMQAAGTSYRGFYTVLERLKQAGLVAASKDDHDQRVRRLKLGSALEIPQVSS